MPRRAAEYTWGIKTEGISGRTVSSCRWEVVAVGLKGVYLRHVAVVILSVSNTEKAT